MLHPHLVYSGRVLGTGNLLVIDRRPFFRRLCQLIRRFDGERENAITIYTPTNVKSLLMRFLGRLGNGAVRPLHMLWSGSRYGDTTTTAAAAAATEITDNAIHVRSAVTLRQGRCGSDIASGPSSRFFLTYRYDNVGQLRHNVRGRQAHCGAPHLSRQRPRPQRLSFVYGCCRHCVYLRSSLAHVLVCFCVRTLLFIHQSHRNRPQYCVG